MISSMLKAFYVHEPQEDRQHAEAHKQAPHLPIAGMLLVAYPK